MTRKWQRLILWAVALLAVASCWAYRVWGDGQTSTPQLSAGYTLKPGGDQAPSSAGPVAGAPAAGAPEKETAKRHDYGSADDLDAYIRDLQSTTLDKSAAPLAQAKAIEECFALTTSPDYAAGLVRQTKEISFPGHDKIVPVIEAYANRLVQRCAKFVANNSFSRAKLEERYAQAADLGSTEAIAHRLNGDVAFSQMSPTGDSFTSDDILPIVRGLVASKDPGTIFVLSENFGEGMPLNGVAVGDRRAVAAWELVACDLGLDCSFGSLILRLYCLNGGMYCGPGGLRANMLQQAFSPDDFTEVQRLERLIYSALKDGTSDALFDGK